MQAGNETAAQQILEDELDNPAVRAERSFWWAPGRAMPGCSRCVASRFFRMRMSCSMTTWPPDGIRELIRRDAEQICGTANALASTPGSQHDTNQMLIAAAKVGATVVPERGRTARSSVVCEGVAGGSRSGRPVPWWFPALRRRSPSRPTPVFR